MALSKNQIKRIKALHLKKFRLLRREFIAEGPKIVLELSQSRFRIKSIFASGAFIKKHIQEIHVPGLEVVEVTDRELNQISPLTSPNEALAVVEIPEPLPIKHIPDQGLILALDTIQDPGNLGAIIRSADWFGIKHIVASEDSVEVYNPKVVQASMGSICRVQTHYARLVDFIPALPEGMMVYGTFPEGDNMYQSKLKPNALVVIGNESQGISKDLQSLIRHKISIPHFNPDSTDTAESLNASIAAALVCAEFSRQNNP